MRYVAVCAADLFAFPSALGKHHMMNNVDHTHVCLSVRTNV